MAESGSVTPLALNKNKGKGVGMGMGMGMGIGLGENGREGGDLGLN